MIIGLSKQLDSAGSDQLLERLEHIGAEFSELLDDGTSEGERHPKEPVTFLNALFEHRIGGEVAVIGDAVEDLAVQLFILVGRRKAGLL